MQNDKKPNGFVGFLRDKGYYIVLLLCAVAGILQSQQSANLLYLFLRKFGSSH